MNTSLSDRQENTTSDSIVTDNNDNNQREERRPQLAADDRRELPTHACRPLISRHAETNEYNRAVLPPARPETNKRERRYSNNRYVDDNQSRVIVPSTWLEMLQSEYSDTYKKRGSDRHVSSKQSHDMLQQECFQADYNLANRQQEEHYHSAYRKRRFASMRRATATCCHSESRP